MMSALPPRSGESPRRGVSRLEMMQVSLTGFYLCLAVLVPLLQLSTAQMQTNPILLLTRLVCYETVKLITSWEIISIYTTSEYLAQKLIA